MVIFKFFRAIVIVGYSYPFTIVIVFYLYYILTLNVLSVFRTVFFELYHVHHCFLMASLACFILYSIYAFCVRAQFYGLPGILCTHSILKSLVIPEFVTSHAGIFLHDTSHAYLH